MSTRERQHWQVLAALSLAVFIGIAVAMMSTTLLKAFDAQIALDMLAHGPPWWTDTMRVLTQLHGVGGISVVTGVWGLYLLLQRQIATFAALALVVYGGLLLNGGLKLLFQRARPVFGDGIEPPLAMLSTYSFPSGHASGSTVFYGFLLMMLFTRTAHHGWRVAAVVGASVMVLLVAYSRVYVGAHFLSDVVAAIAEGLAWTALCVLLLDGWRARGLQRRTVSR